jgi:GT2 family glycosyltransferase
VSHLRSFKKFLFDAIDKREFKEEDGSYFKVTWDRAIMLPIAEMTPPEKRAFYPHQLYYYRLHPGNDHATVQGFSEQKRVEELIHARGPAELLSRYVPKKPAISVVVSCYNQLHVLPMFLESMFFQSACPTQVIVTDDGSSDGVCEWIDQNADKYPFQLVYVTREHNGYRLASLENMGAIHAIGNRILFTNADVIHCPKSIESHLQTEGVGGGVVKGIVTNMAKSVKIELVRDFNALKELQSMAPSWRNNIGYMNSTDPNVNPIGVWGGNFSVPADKFEKVGGFDEGFEGWGGEDNDLVRRLTMVGCKVGWVWDSEVIHLDHDNKQYAKSQSGSSRYIASLSNG